MRPDILLWLVPVFLLTWVVGTLLEVLCGTQRAPDPLAMAASVFYHNAFVEAFTGALDLTTDVIRMLLLVGTPTISVDHDFVDDVSGEEASDGSYARVTLTTPAVTDDDANDRAEWSFDDVVFSSLAGTTATAAVAYQQTGGSDATPADDVLIALWDNADTAADGSDFTLQVGTEGAVQFS
jgi:hypothetical protein